MTTPREALRELDHVIRDRYEVQTPLRMLLPGVRAEFRVNSLQPVDIEEFTYNPPLMEGWVALRGIVLAGDTREVVTVFNGNGTSYAGRMFGVGASAPTLNNLFESAGIPYTLH